MYLFPRALCLVTKDHLQLHGQCLHNAKEPDGRMIFGNSYHGLSLSLSGGGTLLACPTRNLIGSEGGSSGRRLGGDLEKSIAEKDHQSKEVCGAHLLDSQLQLHLMTGGYMILLELTKQPGHLWVAILPGNFNGSESLSCCLSSSIFST